MDYYENPDEYPYEAKRRVTALIVTLEPAVKRDPEQEIQGMAVPVLNAVIAELRNAVTGDPVIDAAIGAYEHELVTGEPVRAFDALLIAHQVDAAIGNTPRTIG